MKQNQRQKLTFRYAGSGFVVTYNISLYGYYWYGSFLYRHNSIVVSSNQNVHVNKLNLVL